MQERLAEIAEATRELALPVVRVVPVRMTEAWLLFDERAIRKAVGNSNGSVQLTLPVLGSIESQPHPKEVLFDLIRRASEAKGRRLDKVRPESVRHQLAGLIEDFSPLRALPAFVTFEAATEETVRTLRERA